MLSEVHTACAQWCCTVLPQLLFAEGATVPHEAGPTFRALLCMAPAVRDTAARDPNDEIPILTAKGTVPLPDTVAGESECLYNIVYRKAR